MRERYAGLFDTYFYFAESGNHNSYSVKLRADLIEEINETKLKDSIKETLQLFPEFAVKPVVKNNRIFYMDNDNEIVLFHDINEVKHLGTDEVNGYPFRFIVQDNSFVMSIYHGVCDFFGMFSFFKTILYQYEKMKGYNLGLDAHIRTKGTVLTDILDRTDPMSKYLNQQAEIVSNYHDSQSDIYLIDEDKLDDSYNCCYSYALKCSLEQFLNVKKRNNATTTSMFAIIFGNAIRNAKNVIGKDIIFSIPVDCRKIYESKSLANFSYGIMIHYKDEYSKMPIEEQARLLDEELSAMNNKAYFDSFMIQMEPYIHSIINGEEKIEEASEKVFVADGYMKYLASTLSYPGRLDMPEGFERDIRDISIDYNCVTTVMVAYTYQDVMTLEMRYKYVTDDIMKAACEYMNSLGIMTKLVSRDRTDGDKMILSEL